MAADPQEKPRPPDPAELIEGEVIEASVPVPVPAPAASERRRDGRGAKAVDAAFDVGERVVAPVVRLGWRGASGVGRRLGINRTVGQAVDRGVDRALESDAAERAADRVLGSPAAQSVWGKFLESQEIQQMIERVTEAPELRTAIASQGVGLVEDMRQGVRGFVRRLDTGAEKIAKRALRRQPRERRPLQAGVVTRGASLLIDWGIIYGALLLISAAIALLASALDPGGGDASRVAIAFGGLVWLLAGALYLSFFWSVAGRTLGMAFVGIRMVSFDGGQVRPGQAIWRVIWLNISFVVLIFGFWGVLFEERRRGWADRRGRTLVLYSDPELDGDLIGWEQPVDARRRPRSAP